jgi:hypothetical protein
LLYVCATKVSVAFLHYTGCPSKEHPIMPASDPKADQSAQSTPRSDPSSGATSKSDPARPGPEGAPSAADPSTQDPAASGDTSSKGKGGAKAKEENKVETVACPSCAEGEQGKPAELVPYPDDGPNEFKRGTAFCEKEGKRVRVDKNPDEDAALASAPTV